MSHQQSFFVSYSGHDRRWAEWIAWQLQTAGHAVSLQAWDFHAGDNFVTKMHEAIREADTTIAVLSPDYFLSRYAETEWTSAIAQHWKERPLVPVKVRECDVEGLLAGVSFVDLVGVDDENHARQKLMEWLGPEQAKTFKKAPDFPGMEKPRDPWTAPSLESLPFTRNINFTGREKYLSALHRTLSDGTSVITIHGLGGVGKTQLALEYVFRHTDNYDLVWWVNAGQSQTLLSDYLRLADNIQVPVSTYAEQNRKIQSVRAWLETNKSWLLVFDDAKDSRSVYNFLPRNVNGHVIITSRDPNWRKVGKQLKLDALSVKNGTRFLLERTGSEEERAAMQLSKALGGLPLALEQAGAYIEATGCSIDQYLSRVRSSQPPVLSREMVSDDDHERTVAKTWEIGFQQIMEDCPEATYLLNFFAFLASEDIPRNLASRISDYLPMTLRHAIQNPVAFDTMIKHLRRFSFVDVTPETFSVHSLVQAVTRQRLVPAERIAWAKSVVKGMESCFPTFADDRKFWSDCALLLPHALSAMTHVQEHGTADDIWPNLAGKIEVFMNSCFGLSGLAEDPTAIMEPHTFEFSADLVDREDTITWEPPTPTDKLPDFSSDQESRPPWTLDSAETQVGEIPVNVDELEDIQELPDEKYLNLESTKESLLRYLSLQKKAHGKNHVCVAKIRHQLGIILKAQKKFKNAKNHFEQALEIFKEYGRGMDLEVATTLHNLGSVERRLGNLDRAKELLEFALEIREQGLGHEHIEVATTLNNLGAVLKNLGEFKKAKHVLERALTIRKRDLPSDHPHVAATLYNLGSVFKQTNNMQEAKRMFEKALEIREICLPARHPHLAVTLNSLALIHQKTGAHQEAEIAYRRVAEIWSAVLRPNHPFVGASLANVGGALRLQGKCEEANDALEKAHEILLEALGPKHSWTKKTQQTLMALKAI